MTDTQLEILRYPIGKFVKPESVSPAEITEAAATLEAFPGKLKQAVQRLTDAQLDTRYRPEGWTIRQVVHHCADSHMNALIRFKLTLTEDSPTIKPYMEARFAELSDAKTFPIASSVQIIEGVHLRLAELIRNMQAGDFNREYIHPEYGTRYRLDQAALLYAWHCNHHLAHITTTVDREGWK